MGYYEDKEYRIQRFERTRLVCDTSEEIIRRILDTRNEMMIFERGNCGAQQLEDNSQGIWVEQLRQGMVEETVRLAAQQENARVGILVEASVHPGGKVVCGGEGVEEELCRCSTLYACLQESRMRNMFYDTSGDSVSEQCLYVPQVYLVGEAQKEHTPKDACADVFLYHGSLQWALQIVMQMGANKVLMQMVD